MIRPQSVPARMPACRPRDPHPRPVTASIRAPTTTPSSFHGYLQSANATQTYLFMDGIHLTQAGQTIIADYYYSLLTAPSQISFLAQSTIETTFGMIYGIQQQIDVSQRQPAGWNVWTNGDLSYLQINNSSPGFPNDPGIPVSGSVGVDYHWANGWLVGGALTGGYLNWLIPHRRKFYAKLGYA